MPTPAKSKEEAETTEAKPESSASGGEDKYSRERLLAESEALVGEPAHVVSGALYKLGGEGDLTVDETKAAVDEFLNSEMPTTSETPPEA